MKQITTTRAGTTPKNPEPYRPGMYMKQISFIVLILLSVAGQSHAGSFEARVIGISDGDTIKVLAGNNQQVKIRLYGIDAPESKQDYGTRAKQFTSGQVFKKTVRVERIDTDRYGRTVGLVYYDQKRCLIKALVNAGFAWVYRQYCANGTFCSELIRMEANAKKAGRGLWAKSNPIAPWDYRKGKYQIRHDKRQGSTRGAYHGNVKSKVVHRQGCQYFNCKNCKAVFNSRDEAIRAEYKPCGRCKP